LRAAGYSQAETCARGRSREARKHRTYRQLRISGGGGEDAKELSPLIKMLGSEADLIRGHQAGAAAGHAFLLAYAPSDLETQRLMNVARRVGYTQAHKYDRFTITKLYIV
jgi:hypothetical protein